MEPLRTADELLRVVVPVEPPRTADELLAGRVAELLRTPVEEVPRAAEEVPLTADPEFTPLAVRLRTAEDETAAVLVPEVRRPSILAVDVRAVLVATRLLPLRRADDEVVMSLASALRFTLLLIEVACPVRTSPLL